MTSDRTTRAKRALELAEKATEGPWVVDTGNHFGLRYCVYVPDAQEALCTINEWSPDVNKRDACFVAESRTLLPALARDVLELDASFVSLEQSAESLREIVRTQEQRIRELEAECNVLRQQRDHDYREALDGFAGLIAEIEWLESVLTAGREMYERACAERDLALENESAHEERRKRLKCVEEECVHLEDTVASLQKALAWMLRVHPSVGGEAVENARTVISDLEDRTAKVK